MIYKGLNRIGMIGDIKTNGGGEIAEVYGGIGESDPIYYKQREMVGTSPMQFKALGLPLKDYHISGNTLQDGTPSPEAPVDVQGVGTRTGNLLHEFYATSAELSGNDYTITKNSIETHNDGSVLGVYFVLTEFARNGNYANYTKIDEKHSFKIHAGTYIFSANENLHSDNNGLRLIVGQLGQSVAGTTAGAINVGVGQTFTVNVDSYVCPMLEIRSDAHVDEYILTNPMLNLGSTALPYEPYGYKLPLTVNGTEYPIYLGQVESTRRIKKLVLTGTVADGNTNITQHGIIYITPTVALKSAGAAYCTHFKYVNQSQGPDMPSSSFTTSGGAGTSLWFKTDYITVADFESYLAAQYAAGTPVTVWYVLAEPETGIVNEPMMKIGDYADTITMEQAGVTIPTITGENVLSVPTEIPPSEIDLTGRLKTSGYGQLLDKNLTAINDSTGTPIFVRG